MAPCRSWNARAQDIIVRARGQFPSAAPAQGSTARDSLRGRL
ncbi:hypothetical protein ACWD4J_16680 [Streptomyces sp. NPDC002577]